MSALIALPNRIVNKVTHPVMMSVGEYNDGSQEWYLYISRIDTTQLENEGTPLYPGAKLIGQWDADGSVATVDDVPVSIDPDYEAYIRPFGNAAGAATDSLNFPYFAGHGQRHVRPDPQDGTLPQYPANRQPYTVRVERTFVDDDGYPATPHGFTFTIVFADPSRAPNARSFGVYSDAACTQYLWTPGAFADIDGTWTINCPVGQRTANESEWNFAMLFGAAQEGRFTLPVGVQSKTLNFFDADQGDTGGGAGWVDSGQTVTGMAGTVTLIQDNSGFNVGDQVRIDGHESEVTSKWTGTGLVLTPYKAHATGATIEVWG